jgi:hypothetical protein
MGVFDKIPPDKLTITNVHVIIGPSSPCRDGIQFLTPGLSEQIRNKYMKAGEIKKC